MSMRLRTLNKKILFIFLFICHVLLPISSASWDCAAYGRSQSPGHANVLRAFEVWRRNHVTAKHKINWSRVTNVDHRHQLNAAEMSNTSSCLNTKHEAAQRLIKYSTAPSEFGQISQVLSLECATLRWSPEHWAPGSSCRQCCPLLAWNNSHVTPATINVTDVYVGNNALAQVAPYRCRRYSGISVDVVHFDINLKKHFHLTWIK